MNNTNNTRKFKGWFLNLESEVQEYLRTFLDPGNEFILPTNNCQNHYPIKDIAPVLELSQDTIREHIKEDKIFARRIDDKWQVPADSIVRYLYNQSHSHTAKEYVPMGIVRFYSTDSRKLADKLMGYKLCSNYEMRNFHTFDRMKELFDGNKEGIYPEFHFILHTDSALEKVGLIVPSLDTLQDRKAQFSDREFNLSNKTIASLKEMASKNYWRMMSVPAIKDKFKELFNKEPDTVDLRLLKTILQLMKSKVD